MNTRLLSAFALTLLCCAHAAPPPPTPEPTPVAEPEKPAPPAGPTRTNFKEISGKLVQRCVGGGWISKWRSEGHMNVARPNIFIAAFEDKTTQGLDPTYLETELGKRMRLSGVYEMVADASQAHFVARGRLLRLAEQDENGRYTVYTATLDFMQPDADGKPGKVVASCDASVRGEM